MRVVFAEYVSHDTRTFDRLGPAVAIDPAKAQAHTRHAVQNPALHRFLPVTGIGQRTALDHTERVLQIGTLRIGGQAVLVGWFRWNGGGGGVCGEKFCHVGRTG